MLQCHIFLLFIICWAGTSSTSMCLVYCHTRPQSTDLQGKKKVLRSWERKWFTGNSQGQRAGKKKKKSSFLQTGTNHTTLAYIDHSTWAWAKGVSPSRGKY